MTVKPSIALMCKSHNYFTKPQTVDVTSPSWVLSKEKASSLIGQNVVLTESQTSPAYMGGVITEVNHVFTNTQGNRTINRYDIVFTPDDSFKGDTSSVGHSGWGCGRAVCFIS